jgi:hypothetical protein
MFREPENYSMKEFVEKKYNQFYKSIEFERKGLFELIKKEFNPKTVLYPGCSIHVTPSFYFNYVVYVDRSDLSKEFFNNETQVSQLINGTKNYKESSFWQYKDKDFQFDLDLNENYFDLLISIFSGKMINYCEKYIKQGGIILTTSLFSDNESIINNDDFELIGMIWCSNKKYKIDYDLKTRTKNKSRLRRKNNGFEYVDNEDYYIYRKINTAHNNV